MPIVDHLCCPQSHVKFKGKNTFSFMQPVSKCFKYRVHRCDTSSEAQCSPYQAVTVVTS